MATVKSIQLTGADANPPALASSSDVFGKLRIIRGTYVTDGSETAGSTIEVARVHKGMKVVPLGKMVHGALGSSTTLALGIAGNTGKFLAATSTSSAGVKALEASAGAGYEVTGELDSIILTTAGATLTSGQTIDVFLAVVQE